MWKTRDAFAKAREDPMFIIEKHRRSAEINFKNNPLKVQKIKEFLVNELEKDVKKKKKHKKKRSSDHRERQSSSSQNHKESRHDKKHHSNTSKSSSSPPRTSNYKQKRSPWKRSTTPRRSRSPQKRTRPSTSSIKDSPGPTKRPLHRHQASRDTSGISKRLTAEELEKRRQEMMKDATERDTARRQRLANSKSQEASETVQNEEGKAQFVHKFKIDSYSSSKSTVEGRIKSNIFSKQRTKADLQNFLKK